MKTIQIVSIVLGGMALAIAGYVGYGYHINNYCWEQLQLRGTDIYSSEKIPFGFAYMQDLEKPSEDVYIGYGKFPFGPSIYIDYSGKIIATEGALWLSNKEVYKQVDDVKQ